MTAAGFAALQRGAWREARVAFEGSEATPAALSGLGTAARGMFDGDAALDAHERGYRLALEQGDADAAARIALELVIDCLNFRGPAEAAGWLERASRLLEPLPPGDAHGMLAYLRANMALLIEHDPGKARAIAGAMLADVPPEAPVDGVMALLSLEGLALVADGEVAEGMRRLDEAATAATSGEVADAGLVEVICCHVIDACKRVRDFDRAGEWCRRVEEISARFGDAELFATCRTFYGEVLVWSGAWPQAETALTAVCRDYAGVPHKALEGLVRLAELRRRQGRTEEAEALVAQAERHPRAALVRAALALDRGEAREGLADAERALRRVGARDPSERVPALELLVRAKVALGEDARDEARELAEIADALGTPALRAAALLARGRALAGAAMSEAAASDAAADGDTTADGDTAAGGGAAAGGARVSLPASDERLREALAALEDAADLFASPYERAEAYDEIARIAPGRGAEQAAARERARLGVERADVLTRREREVLRLLADGLGNDEIASRLVLSVRTVEHHVASIYTKIGASGRTARATATAYALRDWVRE
jgi:ATP/maltotriose-dependent transcriptional regulator MalT